MHPMLVPMTISVIFVAWIFPQLFFGDAAQLPVNGCEGYWPETEVCINLGTSRPAWFRRTSANAGCPQWRIHPNWTGRQEFSTKLHKIETIAKKWEKELIEMTPEQLEECGEDTYTPSVFIVRQRGLAWSRIEDGIMAGNSEFHATPGPADSSCSSCSSSGQCKNNICWTDALLPVYVDKFAVEPSPTFQVFVQEFDVDIFRTKLDKLQMYAVK
mmetsp:Transcript_25257/g.38889  ORF Transcript_25257/g.38889 Transcript_25257/m.38889 type:complete len:214 (-) Transcript_25257:502-1143(-)